MSSEAELAFVKVKPLCIRVSQQRDVISVQQLCDVIKQLSSDAVQVLHEYLLFPLRVIFLQKINVKEDVVVSAADCMRCVLLKSKVKEWKTFEDLCQVLLLLISGTDKDSIFATGSEDKKISVLNVLLSLFETSLGEHSHLFYSVNHIPIVGHIVSVCLSVIVSEKHKRLRKIALCVIKCLCCAPKEPRTSNDKVTRCKIGNCMASFVPGILSALMKVVSGDANQGHAVKCKALETISELLIITASDFDFELANNLAIKEEISSVNVSSQINDIKVMRDTVWMENLSSKMNLVLQHVMTASDNLNANVRIAVLQFSNDMLLYCSKNAFRLHLGTLLKIPCKLLHDKVEKITLKCRQIIDDFSSKTANSTAVTDILQEEIFLLCSSLPKTVAKSSDDEKLHCLNLIIGILEVLKYNLRTVFYSSVHVDNLVKSLVYCFEMDCSKLYKIEEVAAIPINFDHEITSFFKGQSKSWLFKKTFVHFHCEEICEALVKLCRLLGKYGDLEILIDNLKERYELEIQCRSVVVIINEILLGAFENAQRSSIIFEQIDYLLDIYTANENWYLCTSYDSLYALTHHIQKPALNSLTVVKPGTYSLSLKTINSNILLVCLHLEALATFAVVLSRDFRDTLIKSLYPLLEKVNDGNHLINSCALKTLNVIARSCQYKNVAELINKNADYLVSTISIHLRHLGLFPRSPALLQAMLVHCDVDIFPLVRDTVDEILTAVDLHRLESRYLISFLPVMMSIVKAINSWFSEKLVDSASNQFVTEQTRLSQLSLDDDYAIALTKELSTFYTNFKVANLEIPAEELNVDPLTQQNPDENVADRLNNEFGEKKELPTHVTVVEQIVQRSANLLANENPKVRLIVLNVIDEAVLCLSNENDVLLPLVHKLWGPLTARCADSELQVVAKAFHVICNLGAHSGTFLRQKFTKDVLPKLLSFLSKHSKPDITRSSSVTYSHTTLFILQVAILNKLGPLLLSSTVSIKELHAVCSACQNYLSSRQPMELQNASVCLFKCLIDYDSDTVWLFLSDIYSPQCCFKSDFESFSSIAVSGSQDRKSEFASNVSSLLSLC